MVNAEAKKVSAAEFSTMFEETTQPIELIEGEVVMSPAPTYDHQRIAARISWLLGNVVNPNDLGDIVIAPSDVYLDDENVFQPDVYYVAKDNPHHTITDNYLHGSPDLCVEILSPSSVKRDRKNKFESYAANGVREYWIVDPNFRTVEVYELKDNHFVLKGAYEQEDQISSVVLPQLDFKVSEIFPKG